MLHRGRRARAMPMFLAGFEPHDITRQDLFDGTAIALHPATAEGDDQCLPEGVCVPRGGAGPV